MDTQEALREWIKDLIIKNDVLWGMLKNGNIEIQEKGHLKNLFEFIEKEIWIDTTDPQEKQRVMSVITEEFKNIAVEKGISKDQIEKLFAKEISDYKIKTVDISKVPQQETTQYTQDITQAYIEKKENCETCEDTKKALNTTKESIQLWLNQKLWTYHSTIDELESQLLFHRRWENKEWKKLVRECRQLLHRIERIVRKNEKYDKKIIRWRFDIDVRSQADIDVLFSKMDMYIAAINEQLWQLITGDIMNTKKQLPPDVLKDQTNTINFWNGTVDVSKMSPADQKLYKECTQWWSNNSGIKAIGNLIDTKMAPWLDANVTNGKGTRVITGAAKLWLLVANGVMLWNMGKGIWEAIFPWADWSRSKAFQKILLNGALFAGLNYVDPDKVLWKGKELRGWISWNESGSWAGFNKDGSINLDAAISAIASPTEDIEKKIKVHGPMVVGTALSGLSYSQAVVHGIFWCSGNKITSINTEALKEYYKWLYPNNPTLRNQAIQYVNNLESMEQSSPWLFAKVMEKSSVWKSDLEKTENANILIWWHIYENLNQANIFKNALLGRQKIDQALKSEPNNLNLPADQYDRLADGIIKLPPEMQQEIIDKKIQFRTESGQLYMQANGEYVQLNLNDNTHAFKNKIGEWKPFPDGARDVEELLHVTYTMTQAINDNKGKFMVDKPLFYNKDFGERGHTICATTGPRMIDKPMSWVSGQYIKMFDAQRPLFGLLWDKRLEIFGDENVLARYTNYLNDLWIWKWETSQSYIDTEIKTKIAQEYPNLSPADQEKILASYLGLYNTRGDLGAFTYEQAGLAKDKLYKISSEFYLFSKNILWQGWEKLKSAASTVTGRVIEWWTVILQFANGVRKDIWKWLWELYPAETIKAFKQQIETASANQRGLVGQSWAWILNILLGTNFLGEEKNKTKTDEAKKQAEKDKKAKEEGKQEWDKWKTSWKLPTAYEVWYKIGNSVRNGAERVAETGRDTITGVRNWITWNTDSHNTSDTNTNSSKKQNDTPPPIPSTANKVGTKIWNWIRWGAWRIASSASKSAQYVAETGRDIIKWWTNWVADWVTDNK